MRDLCLSAVLIIATTCSVSLGVAGESSVGAQRLNPTADGWRRAYPCVVGVAEPWSAEGASTFADPWRKSREFQVALGVVVDSSGLIVVNLSAVERMKTLEVIRPGRRLSATVVERRPEYNIAVLRVPVEELYISGEPLRSVEIGESDSVAVGDEGFVLQSGDLGFDDDGYGVSTTHVVVSGMPMSAVNPAPLLRLHSARSQAFDDGLLFDEHGKLIGLIVKRPDGTNAAVPSNRWKSLIEKAAKANFAK
jgi:S1-C subfamily serine protease